MSSDDTTKLAHRLLTVPEVVIALRLKNDAAVRTMIRVGKLPAVKVGQRLMVARRHVEEFVAALEARPVRIPNGGGRAAAALASVPSAPLLHGAVAVCALEACPMASHYPHVAAAAVEAGPFFRNDAEQAAWRAARAEIGGAMLCEHANEVPTGECPCVPSCYCSGRTCRGAAEGDGHA